jgi:hypothetical protein
MHGLQKYGKILMALAISLACMIPPLIMIVPFCFGFIFAKSRQTMKGIRFTAVNVHTLDQFFPYFPFPFKQTKKNRWLYHCQLANSPYFIIHALSRFSQFPFSSPGKQKRTDNFTPVNWLKDLLPTEILEARIMTFNYSSRWHRNAPHQDRRAPSDILLEHLHIDRERVWQSTRVLVAMNLTSP